MMIRLHVLSGFFVIAEYHFLFFSFFIVFQILNRYNFYTLSSNSSFPVSEYCNIYHSVKF